MSRDFIDYACEIAVLQNPALLAVGCGSDRGVYIYDWKTGGTLVSCLGDVLGSVSSIAALGDDRILFAYCDRKAEGRARLQAVLYRPQLSMEFHSYLCVARIGDVASVEVLMRRRMPAHTANYRVAACEDGETYVTYCDFRNLRDSKFSGRVEVWRNNERERVIDVSLASPNRLGLISERVISVSADRILYDDAAGSVFAFS